MNNLIWKLHLVRLLEEREGCEGERERERKREREGVERN